MCPLRYAGRTDIGRQRPSNDDRWAADPAQHLYIVADGIASARQGGLAAQLVIEQLPTYLGRHLGGEVLGGPGAGRFLADAVAQLSDDLHARTEGQPEFEAQTTMVAAVVTESRAVVAHLGDSRAYLYRHDQVHRLTRDHSMTQALVDAGDINPGETAHHPMRSMVTQHAGMPPPASPTIGEADLQFGDRVLLCTDGLHGVIDDASLAAVLAAHPDPSEACAALIDAANQAGGPDNITAVVVDILAASPSIPV